MDKITPKICQPLTLAKLKFCQKAKSAFSYTLAAKQSKKRHSLKMTSMTHKLAKSIILILFIIIHFYCDTVKPYELIEFKKDSIWERKRGSDKLEGIWYFDNNELLVIEGTKFNGNLTQSSARKSYWKIKELESGLLILIFLEREGNNVIYTYKSYSEN
ncbi:MAG: hypothetical protein K8R85_09360 [Bacteroidetes bacterium]|nr:hypothetical protein [Bacteroidota bacterium]